MSALVPPPRQCPLCNDHPTDEDTLVCIKVVDFGIARARHEGDQGPITLTGSLTGTPNYMSPEQIQGEAADHRADIYALGLIVYELVSGRQAVPGAHAVSVILKQIQSTPEPLGPQLTGLQGSIDRAIAKDPDARYGQVSQLRTALEALARRHELGALWAGARPGADRAFALIRGRADELLDEIVRTVRGQIQAWRQNPRVFARENGKVMLEWAIHPAPDEAALSAFLERRLKSNALMVRLPDLMGTFSCVFPALRRWAAPDGPGALTPEERALLEDHWSTLEAHFWHLSRVVCACYERFWASDGAAMSDPDPLIDRQLSPRRTLDLVQLGRPLDDLEQTELDPPIEAQERGEFYENVLSSIQTGLLVVDESTWIIRAVNPALTDLLEMEATDLTGRHVLDALRLIRGVEFSELIRQIQDRGRLPPTKIALKSARGRQRWVMARGGLYRDAIGRVRGVMILVDDITERELRVGVGVATGFAVVGNMGSDDRMNYTAVGTVVYRAEQLRGQASAGEVLMDEATADAITASVPLHRAELASGLTAWRFQGDGQTP